MRMKIFTRNGCIHLQQTTIRNVSPPAHTRSIERRMMCEVPRELPQRQHVLATHDHRAAHANCLPLPHQPAAPARHVPALAPPRSRDARPPRAPEPHSASAPARRAHPNRLPSSHQPAASAPFPHPRRHVPALAPPPHTPDIRYLYNFRTLLLLITLHLWQNSEVDKIMYSLWGGRLRFSCVHVSLSTRKGIHR